MSNAQTEGGVRRVLPADVYDALELVAHAYGGIGAGAYGTRNGVDVSDTSVYRGESDPCCVWGAQQFLDGYERYVVRDALLTAGILTVDNDMAVGEINRRAGHPRLARVSFADWCAELGVERGA